MLLTPSSLLIALCLSTVLILFLNFSLKNHLFTLKTLEVLIIIIILTMCFPLEFVFNQSIVAPSIMNPIHNALKADLNNIISKTSIFLFIYFSGLIYKLIIFIKENIFIQRKFKILVQNSHKHLVSHFLPNSKKNYTVCLSEFVSTPSLIGFNKTIFIPSITFNKQELSSILEHEIAHINHHDIFIKFFINILTIIYWWFYPVYIFQKNSNLVLEIRIDHFVTKDKNKISKMKYAQTLIDVQRKILNNHNKENCIYNTNIIDSNINALKCRIQYLSLIQKHSFMHIVIMILLIVSSISVHCISLKSFYYPPVKREYFTENNINELNISSRIYGQALNNSLSPTSKEAQWIYVSTEEHIYKRLWNTETGCWEKNWQFVV